MTTAADDDVLLLREDEIRAVLDMPSCIDAVAEALAAYSSGGAELPAVIHLDIPDASGEIHVKAGYLHGAPIYATKFASGFPGNIERGRAANDGLVLVFDAGTGAPLAFLFDHGCITDIRTGAAGGVAARALAPERVETVAVIGTGAQACEQLLALANVRSFSRVRIWGRNEDRARARVDQLEGMPDSFSGVEFEVAPTPAEAAEGAEVVITVTASVEPLIRSDDVADGAHVTAVGSDGPGKQELEAELLGRADLIVVDSRIQCAERGELQHALGAGIIASAQADGVIELGEVVAGRAEGRTSDRQLTVCDLTGVGVQDVAAAAIVLERAVARGLGGHLTI